MFYIQSGIACALFEFRWGSLGYSELLNGSQNYFNKYNDNSTKLIHNPYFAVGETVAQVSFTIWHNTTGIGIPCFD